MTRITVRINGLRPAAAALRDLAAVKDQIDRTAAEIAQAEAHLDEAEIPSGSLAERVSYATREGTDLFRQTKAMRMALDTAEHNLAAYTEELRDRDARDAAVRNALGVTANTAVIPAITALKAAAGNRYSDGQSYLLWSQEHQAWWKAGADGYTDDRTEAGRFLRGTALHHIAKSALKADPSKVSVMVVATGVPKDGEQR